MINRTWAVLADIHGNSWALDAVLADLHRRGVTEILNLGDCLYGPLDPEGTAERLLELEAPTVRGNQDRNLLAPPPAMRTQPTFLFMDERLTDRHRAWLATFPATLRVEEEILLCHGTPGSDEELLLEDVRETGVFLMPAETLESRVAPLDASIVLCAHSHVPRTVWAGRTGVINPGSVGLPAYTAAAPWPHAMESGSPHARYVLLSREAGNWRVEHVAVPYDWKAAAEAARRNGRPDWGEWIETGRACRP
ncbi:MAG TPA: metallophosphoesterase family protein [Thermoanaerobaculia bacterium]|nr:metallophosphoesterase family protein [Thermoanaerobaculia bacterium]